MEKASSIILSIGGNAIIRRNEAGTVEEQFENLERACSCMARIVSSGGSVIVTHGNCPIVGNIVIRNEAARNTLPPMPLYICDADSEGGIGFMIQQIIYNSLRRIHKIKDVVAVVTQVVVDPRDSAFESPAKPVGPYYDAAHARALTRERGWTMAEAPSGGFRRVVPSPRPVRVVEAAVIKRLADSGVVVIAAGGGGVPVVEHDDGTLTGVDAVIDKDLATSLLARETGAEVLINLTEVDMVYRDFGGPEEAGLADLSVDEASEYLVAGEFPPGSMGPKVEAAVEFIEAGGREVLITSPRLVEEAIEHRAGTRIHA